MIVVNGRIVAQAPQFDVQDVHVISATVDLDDVRSYRASQPSFGIQAARLATEEGGGDGNSLLCDDIHLVFDPLDMSLAGKSRPKVADEDLSLQIAAPEEECCLGPACWLWDFLRRSGAAGFFLPLSGKCGLSWLLHFFSCCNDDIKKQNYSRYGHPINTEREPFILSNVR